MIFIRIRVLKNFSLIAIKLSFITRISQVNQKVSFPFSIEVSGCFWAVPSGMSEGV
jgi:hypothetical protein